LGFPPRYMARQSIQDLPASGVPARAEAPARSTALNLLLSLRPGQWTKNLVVFAALIFGLRLFDVEAVARAAAAFVVFCALSGVVYLVNDVVDREADRLHPIKARRPIASGALPTPVALAAGLAVAAVAIAASFALGPLFGLTATAYTGLLGIYTAFLKHIVIIDVLTIASGFVLRAIGGAVAIDVLISHWLLVCTVLLALFLALSKRRHELVALADAPGHRRILEEYSPYLLDQMIAVVTASTLMAYAFYTISPETQQKFGTGLLSLTIPFPLYGIFRYLYLVHRREGGGSPADMLLNDRPLLLCVALWVATVVVIVYGF
jgi:4-hydroxybenzoate polyprenyltransferase